MKITSASKKVLCSALSAAMVVAFAPTVAFAGPAANDDSTGGATLTYVKDNATKTETFDTLQKAVDAAAKANGTSAVITLDGDATVSGTLDIAGVKDGMTIDMAGHTLSTTQEFYKGGAATIVDVAANKPGKSTYSMVQYTNTSAEVVYVKGTMTNPADGITKVDGDDSILETVANTDYAENQWFVYNGEVYNTVDNSSTSVATGTAGYYSIAQGISDTVATGTVTFKNGAITTFNADEDYLAINAAADIVLDGMTIAAETAVTAAWKSGSAKITVTSAGKVKLAKGVKRGTYTAKVTLAAAASDAYYAASKTITVKFTIK